MVEAFKESFAKARRQGRRGAVPAVPGGRIPVAAHADRARRSRTRCSAFFAGGGAVKFVKDYAAAGLKKSIPLYGPGFLTDGTLEAQGEAAERHQDHAALRRRSRQSGQQGVPRGVQEARPSQDGDVYAVQGYDCRARCSTSASTRSAATSRRATSCIAAMRRRQDQLAARADQLLQGAQLGAEHLSARGRRAATNATSRSRTKPRRSGARLPDGG